MPPWVSMLRRRTYCLKTGDLIEDLDLLKLAKLSLADQSARLHGPLPARYKQGTHTIFTCDTHMGGAADCTWRGWAFGLAHETFLNPHRTASDTFQIIRRMCWWETMAMDVHKWCMSCAPCRQFRARPVQPPFRSLAAVDQTGKIFYQ